jgi:ATP-binding cassette subfamily B protein
MGLVLIALLAYFLVQSSTDNSLIIAMLGALAVGAQRLLPVLQLAYASWSSIIGGKGILSSVLELLEQPLPVKEYDKKILPFKDKIIFQNIRFQYSKSAPITLSNIALEIKKGSCIGLIGETGSGKSTFLDILMGLLLPSEGSIIIDDVIIDNDNYINWQANIAHVPQNIFLSDSSILENIAFGSNLEDIDHERVKNACKIANIDNIISSWSDGYNSRVGERGVKISGGQKQRIGIARAIYKNASVLVLDEATSALDNETETEVMTSINQLSSDLTIIMVAHRLSSLKNCSHIIKLDKGKISKIGSYEELINI